MKTHSSRNPSIITQWTGKKGNTYKHPVSVGKGDKNKTSVTIYRRKTPQDNWAFMVANYAGGQGNRRLDSYPTEQEAIDAADTIGRKLLNHEAAAALITNDQASQYFHAVEAFAPFNVTVREAADAVAKCLKFVGTLDALCKAAQVYGSGHTATSAKRVADVVVELLTTKESEGAAPRYVKDLRSRLTRFANDCQKDAITVTTADVQAWLDGKKLEPQNKANFRRVLYTLFEFAISKGYAVFNPVERVRGVKVRNGDIEIFKPVEIARLLAAATPDFLPSLAIGAFAGLRSAEIERLEWSDIDLDDKEQPHITVGAKKAKTASRRTVDIHDNLAAWLALTPEAERKGLVWKGADDWGGKTRERQFYIAQQVTAAATEVKADPAKGIKHQEPVKWKSNALRHSFISYRLAEIKDVPQVAMEAGNSVAVVHRHYKELVKPADAEKWFAVKPDAPANDKIINLPKAARA